MNLLRLRREETGVRFWELVQDERDDDTEHVSKEARLHIKGLIVSDLHLGTSAFKAQAFQALFNTFWIEKYLIFLGDIFDDGDFRRIPSSQWKVLGLIRKLTNPKKNIEEVWVEGNHDSSVMVGVVGALVGLEVQSEFEWSCGPYRYLAIHGDVFHWFITRFPFITKLVVGLYKLVHTIDPLHRHIGSYLARKTSDLNNEHNQVAEGAIRYGRSKGVDFVICGHTHLAMRRKSDCIEYINTGCWIKNPCTFVTFTEEGPILNYIELP